jgi:nucleotidyltransferase/DNA polymerase involved in DNA repair
MRILCLFISHFPLQVEDRDSSTLKGKLVIIGGLPHEPKKVYDASPQALERGVKIGMSLRHAYSLCPEAHFLPTVEEKYELVFEEVLETLDSFSPLVERHDLGTAFLDARGLGDYYNGEENLSKQLLNRVRSSCRLSASVGIAGSKFPARVAATISGPGEFTIIPADHGKGFLAPLPLDVLPCSEKLRKQFRLLGIKTVGEIARLGSQAMMAQFGEEGLLIHQLACGVDESPLVPRKRPARIERAVNFEPPVETLDELLSSIGEALDSLSHRLKEQWQLCGQMELSLHFDNGNSKKEVLNLRVPTRSKKTLLSLLRLRLEQARFESPLSEARITLSKLCKDGKQLYLPTESARRRQQIAPVAREIRSRLGKNMLKRPILLAQEALLPEEGFILRDIEV